jgi:hypothetical protein
MSSQSAAGNQNQAAPPAQTDQNQPASQPAPIEFESKGMQY